MRFSVIIFLCLLCTWSFAQTDSTSWQYASNQETFVLKCYWFDSQPFIYPTPAGISGIEYDVISDFAKFVNDTYGVELKLDFIRTASFRSVYDTIKQSKVQNAIGISSFSITTERTQEIDFTDPYMPDISVIVSDYDLPIAYNHNQFDSIFDNRTAITIPQTTFEQHLNDISAQHNLNFKYKYIQKSGDIIRAIARTDSSFGYIDLPTYLNSIRDTVSVKRQYLFSFTNRGLSFALPKNSDWKEPFHAYFNRPEFSDFKNKVIAQHFGEDVPFLINNIASGTDISSRDEVLLLTKEKEIQSKELIDAALAIQRENLINRGFIIGIIILAIIVAFIYNQYRLKAKSNELLNSKNMEIERQNQQLLELNAEKNNLINILAHDLRAPINSISGLAQMLKAYPDENDREEFLDKIQQSTERVNSMIKKILDVESIESEKTNLSLEVLDLKEIIRTVVDTFSTIAKGKDIKIKTRFKESVNYKIKADAVYLQQVFENLISNALKFSEAGTKVTVKLQKNKNNVRGIVSDQGPGISKEDQKKLFNKFQRLSAKPTKGEQSIGLGLSIVKKYLELMNGRIYCESRLGHGTDFIVEFDRA